jgi:hypothetical protein
MYKKMVEVEMTFIDFDRDVPRKTPKWVAWLKENSFLAIAVNGQAMNVVREQIRVILTSDVASLMRFNGANGLEAQCNVRVTIHGSIQTDLSCLYI